MIESYKTAEYGKKWEMFLHFITIYFQSKHFVDLNPDLSPDLGRILRTWDLIFIIGQIWDLSPLLSPVLEKDLKSSENPANRT